MFGLSKKTQNIVLFLAALAIVFDVSYSLLSTCQPIGKGAANHGGPENYCTPLGGLIIGSLGHVLHWVWHFLGTNEHELISGFTIVLAGSTIALWLSTRKLWKVTSDTLHHAERTAEMQMRAYVSIGEIKSPQAIFGPDGNIRKWAFTGDLRNTGLTPAKKLTVWAAVQLFETQEQIDAVDFSKPRVQFKEGELKRISIGPGGKAGLPQTGVTVADVDKALKTQGRLVWWGRAEYSDIFKEARIHPVAFCYQIAPSLNGNPPILNWAITPFLQDCNFSD
jgi:hypothetical protein